MAIQTAIDSINNSSGSPFGFKNRIINGAMVIDQRNNGSSVSPSNVAQAYGVDRFPMSVSQNSKCTIQQNAGSVTPPAGFSKYYGFTVDASANVTVGAADYFGLQQRIEGNNLADMGFGAAGASSFTVSFWVRASVTGTFGFALQNGAQTRSYATTYVINAANTWEYKTITVAGDTSGTWATDNTAGMVCSWGLGIGSTYAIASGSSWTTTSSPNGFGVTGTVQLIQTNSATFYITGIQLEKGSTATSFDYRPYGTELALCQRYAQPCGQGGTGRASSSTGIETTTQFRVPMRATPIITFGGFSGAQTEISQFGVGSVTVSAVASSGFASSTGSYLSYTTSGATTGSFCACIKGDTSFANAEL